MGFPRYENIPEERNHTREDHSLQKIIIANKDVYQNQITRLTMTVTCGIYFRYYSFPVNQRDKVKVCKLHRCPN